MSSYARIKLIVTLASAIAAMTAPAAHAGFGVEEKNFEAGTCVEASCLYSSPPAAFFTHAAGHPPFGITAFEFNSEVVGLGKKPIGAVKNVRVDIPPGVAANPEALPKCPIKGFEENSCPANTEVGTNYLTIYTGVNPPPIEAPVYNLEPGEGLPLEFGIKVTPTEHAFLKGHVSWNTDYHEYFEINNISETVPLLKSKLVFKGQAGKGNFLTLPSECPPSTTSHLRVESRKGEVSETYTHTPVGVEHCNEVPFKPTAVVTPETAQSDQPDGITAEVKAPQNAGPGETNTADIRDAHVTLPEGMTLNPSAARGLEACTATQIGIGTMNPVTCPLASKIGNVAIETDLPSGSLAGNVYLGNPAGGPITGPPYTIYVDAETARFGVSVRLKGQVSPNPTTGRLETTFAENPQLPFSDFILKLNGGALAPVANPLACGTGQVEALFTPYTGSAAALTSTPFVTGGCPSSLPFTWSQSTPDQPANAGAHASFTFNLARSDGQQYLAGVSTVLPAGLVGLIPSVALCGEPQAANGACPSASQIGVATVSAGAGAEPYSFEGPVFLTGPYRGGPFGLSIAVPAVAGPFNLGAVVARAAINVDPTSARVSVAGAVPTIVGGVPLRLKTISVAVNRANFLLNPTNCGALATETTLTSTFGATQNLPTPFAVGNCGALRFKPSFAVSTNAASTKANGASLETTLAQGPGEANIKSVSAQLPPQLVSRLTTLQQACPEATFAANPASCPTGSNVGNDRAITPVLPGTMSGQAYLVSHAAAAFPDLDLILEDSGVRVILVGNTNIHQGVTTTTFAAVPDVPVSSFTLALPMGPHSALAANGSLCQAPLVMPTTITAQNGAQVKQNTSVSVLGCSGRSAHGCIRILRRKVLGHALVLTVRACAAGRVSAAGRYLKSTSRKLRRASTTKLTLALSSAGRRALAKHRPLKIRVRVVFAPSRRGSARTSASTTFAFKR